MKNIGLIYFILGVLAITTIYSLWRLSSISKSTSSKTGTGSRIIGTIANQEASNQPTPASEVSASDLSNAVRKQLEDKSVTSLTVNFSK